MGALLQDDKNVTEIFRIILESSPLLVEIWNENYEILDCNQNTVDMFNISSKEEYLQRYHEFSPEFQLCGTPSNELDKMYAVETIKNGFIQYEWMHQLLDGTPIPTEVSCVSVELGGKTYILGYTRDIRNIKQEREIYNLTKNFLDAAPFFINIWDEKGEVFDCNLSMMQAFDFGEKEEFTKNFFDSSAEYQPCGTPSKEKMQELLKECFKYGHAKTEWLHVTCDGEPFPVDAKYVRIQREDDYVAVGYSKDLRQIKKNIEMRQEAEEQSSAKTQFLARMSHEIRTPINVVLGISEIELQKDNHTPEVEESFRRVYNASKNLLDIINDLLDLAKFEAGKMDIVLEEYETASFITDVNQLNNIYVGSKRIEFVVEVDETLPAYLIGDELRIKQTLNNILSNAFKYTDEGSVKISFKVGEIIDDRKIMLEIGIADTGQGMDEEQIKKLFTDDYIRFNLKKNRTVQGSGLGMRIVSYLLKMMDGKIRVDSELGNGTTVTVQIPQAVRSEQMLGKEVARSLCNFETVTKYLKGFKKIDYKPMPHGHILLVDDMESNLFVAKGFLAPYKLNIETANSGRAVINLIKKGKEYDIIFMDHMMPDMDGLEVGKALFEMGYSKPIVAMTANATLGVSEMFMNTGFSGFVSKPIDPVKLDDCLRKFIKEREPRRYLAKDKFMNDENSQDAIAKDFSDKLKEAFLLDAERSVAVLEPLVKDIEKQSKEDFDYKLLALQVHALKSVLNNILEVELAEVAARLEEAGNNKDFKLIKDKTPQFLENVHEVIDLISSGRKEDERAEGKINGGEELVDEDFISEQLLAIARACEEYDTECVRNLLDKFKERKVTNNIVAAVNEIEKQLILSNDEYAAEIARQAASDIMEDKEGTK